MKRLLIIDDDPCLLQSLCAVFKDRYQVEAALSCEAADAHMRIHTPDVILLDAVLPDADGVAFLGSVRARCPQIPVVMISGATSIRTIITALETGAVDFIRKPFDIHELRLRIARALYIADLERRAGPLNAPPTGDPAHAGPEALPLKQAVECFERKRIEAALTSAGGIVTRAAEQLGTTRRILQYRIRSLGITGEAPAKPPGNNGSRGTHRHGSENSA